MNNTLDYILNFKKLVTVKELQKELESSQSTIYSMAEEKNGYQKKFKSVYQESLMLRKSFGEEI